MTQLMANFTRYRRLAFTVSALLALTVAGVIALRLSASAQDNPAETVREYSLSIDPTDIDYGNGGIWHAWTFKRTVPGPTLGVNIGETLRVKVTNLHNMVHSFHTHLGGYSSVNDGSQANYITGEGVDGMLEPNIERTWEFGPPTPGLFYSHTHSADKGFTPAQVVSQGLYGAIIVSDPEEPPIREEVLILGEVGFDTEGTVVPFVINGLGLPGGEVALKTIIAEEGYAGLAKRFDKTIPYIQATVNEPFKLHVINIGNLEHSLYIHSATVVSLGVLRGRVWPARVVPLVQGAADTLLVNFTEPRFWLFHRHAETHDGLGMLGLFDVRNNWRVAAILRRGGAPGITPLRPETHLGCRNQPTEALTCD